MAAISISERLVTIYGLVDPITTQLRYIGKTLGEPHRRLLAHISDVRRGRTYIPRHKWIAGLISTGSAPEIVEIERVVESDWAPSEQFWIEYFRFVGCDLLNATAGGDGLSSYKHRSETKKRQSKSAFSRYQRLGERERTGSAVSVAFARPEVRKNLSDGRKKVPRESLQISIDALIRKARSPEGRAATSARSKGKILSAETRSKLSAALKGKTWSADRKATFSAYRTGKKHSEETKAKMRAAAGAQTARDHQSKVHKVIWTSREYRERRAEISRKTSENLKKDWADPIFRAKRIAANKTAREYRRAKSESEIN